MKYPPYMWNQDNRLLGIGQEMGNFISNNLDLSRTYTTEAAFKNLKSGQVDYMLRGLYTWEIAAKKRNDRQWCQTQHPPLTTEGMYITFSKKSDLQALTPQLNRIIKRLQEDGSLEQWRNQHMQSFQTEQEP